MADYTGTAGNDTRTGATGNDRFLLYGGNDTAFGAAGRSCAAPCKCREPCRR